MRLIDAFALESRMYHDAFEVDSDMQKWDSGCWIRYKMFENAIKDAPTIEERKKGKWYPIGNTGLATCECGFITDRHTVYNFCPDCGSYNGGGDE